MTFYTTFTTADGIKASYIYQTKRQLIAADQSGTFKAMQEVKHNKAEAGIKAIKAHLQNNGYKVLRPVKANQYSGGDFLLPFPGKEYFLKHSFFPPVCLLSC